MGAGGEALSVAMLAFMGVLHTWHRSCVVEFLNVHAGQFQLSPGLSRFESDAADDFGDGSGGADGFGDGGDGALNAFSFGDSGMGLD